MTTKAMYKRTRVAWTNMCKQLAEITVAAETELAAQKKEQGINLESEPLFEAITVIEALSKARAAPVSSSRSCTCLGGLRGVQCLCASAGALLGQAAS